MGNRIVELCLVSPQLFMSMLALVARWSLHLEASSSRFSETSRLQQRQAESAATPTSSATRPNPSVASVLSDYWYVCLVVLVMIVVGCVFLCACIVRKKRRQGRLHISQTRLQRADSASQVDAGRGMISSGLELASAGSPGSVSIGQSPISSPQPSFSSSHKSVRSSGRGSHRKKRRNHSPGRTSSGSEDTIRPNQSYSASSLASSVSTLGPHSGRLNRAEVAMESPLHSAPSSLSIESCSSSRPSSRLTGTSRTSSRLTAASGVVKVDVKVHLDQEQPAHFQIAAALAESARQLAQSAANFEQEDTWTSSAFHSPRSNLSSPRGSVIAGLHNPSCRQLFSNHSTSALMPREQSALSLRDRKISLPMASLDRPANLVSLDRPANLVSLDRPAGLVRPVHEDRTGITRRNSITSYKSDSSHYQRHATLLERHAAPLERMERHAAPLERHAAPLERHAPPLERHAPPLERHAAPLERMEIHAAPLEHGYRVPPGGYLYDSTVWRGEDHAPNGFHHFPKPLHQIHTRPVGKHLSNANDFKWQVNEGGGGYGSKSGSGCDSNASTLKALSRNHSGSSVGMSGTDPVAGCQHARQLSLLSEQGSDSLQEAPSPHSSSSHPSLSRTGSALSLDPQLSSTASGYAATGSTSSLDTIAKTTSDTATPNRLISGTEHSLQGKVFPEHIHPPLLVTNGKAAPVHSFDIHAAMLAETTSLNHARAVPRNDVMMYHHMVFGSEGEGTASSPENFTIDV